MEDPKTTALAKQGPQSIAAQTFAPLAGYEKDDLRGKEGIEAGDLKLAYLSVAQKSSKAIDETDDKHIEGLKLGDLYDTELRENHGRGPIAFIPIRTVKSAFIPDANGRKGEVVAWDDPRTEWPSEEAKKTWKGKGKPKPEAVRVIDAICLVCLPSGNQLMIISFQSTGFPAGQSLMKFITMTKGPAFSAKFALSTELDENEAGKYAKLFVKPAGKPTDDEAKEAEFYYEATKGRKIAEEGDPEHAAEGKKDPDDIPF